MSEDPNFTESDFAASWGVSTANESTYDYETDISNPDVVTAVTMTKTISSGFDPNNLQVRIGAPYKKGILFIKEDQSVESSKERLFKFPADIIDDNNIRIDYCPTNGEFSATFPYTAAFIKKQRDDNGPDFGNKYTQTPP